MSFRICKLSTNELVQLRWLFALHLKGLWYGTSQHVMSTSKVSDELRAMTTLAKALQERANFMVTLSNMCVEALETESHFVELCLSEENYTWLCQAVGMGNEENFDALLEKHHAEKTGLAAFRGVLQNIRRALDSAEVVGLPTYVGAKNEPDASPLPAFNVKAPEGVQ